MSDVPELTPVEVVRRWPDAERDVRDVLLLDERQPAEVALAAIGGTCHIPMQQVPARLEELPRDKPIVVLCHLGGRSRRVAQFLAANGFEQVFNLAGGIDAWSLTVDERINRY